MSETTTSPTPPSPWRTVIASLGICAMQLAGFLYLVRHGVTMESASAFGSLCTCSTGIALGLSVKALGEHLGNGAGVKGALSALMSETKPGEPAPAPGGQP
jgi:hypothetical protein